MSSGGPPADPASQADAASGGQPDRGGGGSAKEADSTVRRRYFRRLAKELELPPGYRLPQRYEIDQDGVWEHRTVKDDSRCDRVISAPLVLTRVFMDPAGLQMVEIAWRDRKRWVRRVVPRSAMVSGKTLVTALADAGLPVISSRAAAAEQYLAAVESQNRDLLEPVLIARHLGWQQDGTFVYAPGKPRQVEPVYPEQAAWLSAHHQHGTLSGWLDAIKPLEAYPVAQMVLCAGFTAVLLEPLGLASHTVDVSGRSTRGKTTTAKAAASLWADPSEQGDAIFSWRTKDISAEKRLNIVRGLPVVFDETRVATSHELVDRMLYQVSKDRGQARGGGWPSLLPWQTVLISTGEQSALSFTSHQGAAARVLSVTRPPFPAGGSAATDVRAVNEGISDHYGHAGPAFVNKLVLTLEGGGADNLRDRHHELTRQLSGTTDISGRRAPALAAHVLAGQLAHEWGLLPFTPPAPAEWLNVFQAEEETDDRGEMALNVVRELVASSGQALWRPGWTERQQPHSGWIGRRYEHDAALTVALLPQKLKEALERAGYALDAVLPIWKEAGVVLKLGKDRTPWLLSRECGGGKARMYIFAPGAIDISAGGGDDDE